MDEKSNIVVLLLNNQWIITVFGGLILTGLIKTAEKLYGISKANKDVKQSNKEVVNFLEKVIINRTKLKEDFLGSIISAIARKNEVPLKKMNSKIDMLEDTMIKLYEIDYLPMDEKNEIVESLLTLKKTIETRTKEQKLKQTLVTNEIRKTDDSANSLTRIINIMREILPLYLLILTVMTVLMLLLSYIAPHGAGDFSPREVEFISLLLLLLVMLTLVLYMANILEKKRKKDVVNFRNKIMSAHEIKYFLKKNEITSRKK